MAENRWKILLDQLQMSQRELAESIGVDRGYLSRIVNGQRQATSRIYVLLNTIYGVRKEWLCGDDEGPIFAEDALGEKQRRLVGMIDDLTEDEARAVLAFIRYLKAEDEH